MEAVVRFDGVVAEVLELLVDRGYFHTRSEAIRAGVLELGKEFRLLDDPKEIEDMLAVKKMQRMDEEIKSGRRKTISFDAVLGKYGLRRSDLK